LAVVALVLVVAHPICKVGLVHLQYLAQLLRQAAVAVAHIVSEVQTVRQAAVLD
jgi:hypothetical protein